jgi:uridine phosphorylase
VGDIVIAEWVVSAGDPASRKSCDPGMADRAKRLAGERGFGTFAGGLAGAAQPATTPGEKARLWTATGALAVDLESAAAAAAAEAAGGVPFLAVRVITDDSRTALPDFRSGWKKPARLLKDGAGFVGRIAAMRRALRAHQEFLRLFLSRFPPPSDDPSHVGRSPGGQADRRS